MRKRELEDILKNLLGNDSKINIFPVSSHIVDVTAISDKFSGLNMSQRQSLIQDEIKMVDNSITLSLASLYTVDEAKALDIEIKERNLDHNKPTTWLDLVHWGKNEIIVDRSTITTGTVSFYSFKGGVGRSTALAHVAWELASRGKKIVVVDLDFEAPSIHQAFDKINAPVKGLVDYLYERFNLNYEEQPSINVPDIIGEIPVSKGKLYIIPAGHINEDYIAKVDDLRNLPVNDQGVWEEFKEAVIKQVQPDLILIDSRTGFNIWGALSLLTVADQSIVFVNPNPQNREGVITILSSLHKIGIYPTVVLSPVLSIPVGRRQALKEWNMVCDEVQKTIKEEKSNHDDLNDIGEELEEPIVIPYSADIAMAGTYPCLPWLSLYHDIANLLDSESDSQKLVNILAGQERWKVIKSLDFPQVDAKSEKNPVKELFQKTGDFERFIEHATILIKGKKGTGKTQLYYTTLKHLEVVKDKAGGKLDNVIPISGHGPVTLHPTREDFSLIHKRFEEYEVSWERFWRSYALYRLITTANLGITISNKKVFRPLKELLKQKPASGTIWTSQHTEFLMRIASDDSIDLLIRDAIQEINIKLANEKKILWVLYDDLDQDIQEYTQIQRDAISGLFAFSMSLENIGINSIRPKIFLRSDIWQRLNFTNKSHLVGRDVELKWTREDFLRLAYRQACMSEEYRNLVAKFSPISDPDQASEEMLEKALELLWGISREKGKKGKKVSRWVHERLTDAGGTTFPRALTILLKGAKEHELDYLEKPHVPSPTDRLLRANSLNEGLFVASKERCEELKQEYKELDDTGFFSLLSSISQITDLTPIEDWWKKKEDLIDKYNSFEQFMNQIQQMGLAAPYDETRWRFADIYVHGFKMKRSGGRI